MRIDRQANIHAACITLVVVSIAAGCYSSQGSETRTVPAAMGKGFIRGTASFLEGTVLPKDAVFEAVLQDVSRPDAPGTAMGMTVLREVPEVPVSFSIEFDSARIEPRRNYVVRTRLLEGGKPKWVSERAHPVLTQGNGTRVRIAMRRVGVTEQIGPDGGDLLFGGELTYLGDIARLTECSSQRIFPVSSEGDFTELHAAYMKLARSTGAPLFVTFEGLILDRQRITGSGVTATVVVNDFIEAWPSQSCATSTTNAPLLDTRWQIVRIGSTRTSVVTGQRDATLVLAASGDSVTYSASAGCTSVRGTAKTDGDQIAFSAPVGAAPSCGDALDSLERQLADALQKAVHWQILGSTLEFEDINGETVATFETKPVR